MIGTVVVVAISQGTILIDACIGEGDGLLDLAAEGDGRSTPLVAILAAFPSVGGAAILPLLEGAGGGVVPTVVGEGIGVGVVAGVGREVSIDKGNLGRVVADGSGDLEPDLVEL